MDTETIKNQILEEVGAGRLTAEEARAELAELGIYVEQGFFHSLLAFSASSLLVEAGFNRNGF